jgi:CheY-like chemotaxis protein
VVRYNNCNVFGCSSYSKTVFNLKTTVESVAVPTVLIIDDYELNMKLVEDLLTFNGYRALTAYNAEDGVRLAREKKPDLILMDMRLSGPGIDGWTATRLIKRDRETRHIPVVALTAQVWDSERERAIEAGCDEYITKPFNIYELKHCIDGYLQAGAGASV